LRAITRKTILVLVGGAMVLALAGVAGAGNGSGNKNGDFEMGDFTKWVTYCDVCWTTPGDPGGNWFVSGKKETPINNFSWFGPMQKEFEAVTDEVGPSTLVLTRTVSLGKGSRINVDLEWNNQAGVWCDPGTLTTSDFCATSFNQQIWIDLQPVGADPFLKGGPDTAKSLWHTEDSTATKQGKTQLRFDLGKLSGKYVFRVAVVAGQFYLNVGIDEFSVNNGG
jgi:hypothetical protein